MKINDCLVLATLGATLWTGAQGTRTFAQATPPPPSRAGGTSDPTSGMKASLKARFGFSDAQANTVIQRSQAIATSYRPRFLALQKKYLTDGRRATPEQRKRFQKEIIPLFAELAGKTNAVLLAVATKEQRPRVLAQMNAAKSQSKPLK